MDQGDRYLAEIQCPKSYCDGFPGCLMYHRDSRKNDPRVRSQSRMLRTPVITRSKRNQHVVPEEVNQVKIEGVSPEQRQEHNKALTTNGKSKRGEN